MYDPRDTIEYIKNYPKYLMEDEDYLYLDGIDAIENKLFFLFQENEQMRRFYVVTAHPDSYILAYYNDSIRLVERSELDLLETLKSHVHYHTETNRFLYSEITEETVERWSTGRLL